MAMRIYLAGPDVFLPDAAAIGGRKKAICAVHGFEGVFPFDATIEDEGLEPAEAGFRIYAANIALMRSCDLLIANMTPFRGPSLDAGTAFEMGVMRALGRPVLGYTNVLEDYHTRAAAAADGGPCDAYGMSIEDFGMADNLMLEGAVRASGFQVVRRAVPEEARFSDLAGFAACVALAAARLKQARA